MEQTTTAPAQTTPVKKELTPEQLAKRQEWDARECGILYTKEFNKVRPDGTKEKFLAGTVNGKRIMIMKNRRKIAPPEGKDVSKYPDFIVYLDRDEPIEKKTEEGFL